MKKPVVLATFCLAWCLFFPVEPVVAEGTKSLTPFARARLEPESKVTVGQPISVIVEVLVPSWFTGAPVFPDLDIPDSITIFSERGSNFTERIDGQTWAGQSRHYTVYAQRSGSFSIPSIPIAVKYYGEGVGAGATATVSPQPLTFTTQVPVQAQGLDYFIATTQLTLTQEFDRTPHMLKIGEAFTRVLTVTIHDALSMVIPSLPSSSMDGISVYPEPPTVSDTSGERGSAIVGTRKVTTTYVAEQEGDYQLPAIEIHWWDIGAKQLRSATLPPVEFHVNPEVAFDSAFSLPQELVTEETTPTQAQSRVSLVDLLKRWGIPLGVLLLVLIVIAKLARRYGPPILNHLAQRRTRQANSEASWFRQFRHAARSGDPRAALRHLMFWLDRIHDKPGAATLHSFSQEAVDPSLTQELEKLEDVLFGSTTTPDQAKTWSWRPLLRQVSRARARHFSFSERSAAKDAFGSLNPGVEKI